MDDIECKMRKILNFHLQVFYVKDVEKNKAREEAKRKSIEWMIAEILAGPNLHGVQGTQIENPDFTWVFGSDIWKAEQKCILLRDPVCRMCGKNPSVEVHHIRPKHLKGNPEHPRNLIGLCMECHDEVHRRIDAGIQTAIDESLKVK